MKNFKLIIIIGLVVILGGVWIFNASSENGSKTTLSGNDSKTEEKEQQLQKIKEEDKDEQKEESKEEASTLQEPLSNPSERVTKKPFGIFITPQNSPIEEERFSGYHTGTDFEVLEGEISKKVPVKAICSGEALEKRYASGYGGLIVQRCEVEQQKVTVIYGHLDLENINFQEEENIEEGDKIGILGEGNTQETDRERKHLHLGIYKGEEINIKGYVDSEQKLSKWLNPCDYVCGEK